MVSTAFYLGKEKLRHSLGRPSRSDFVQFEFVEDIKMAQIIWDGNKNWENVWDGKQPWDREIEEKSIPENAVLIDRTDDIIKVNSIHDYPLYCMLCCNFCKKGAIR